jgi:hypothetical protein
MTATEGLQSCVLLAVISLIFANLYFLYKKLCKNLNVYKLEKEKIPV